MEAERSEQRPASCCTAGQQQKPAALKCDSKKLNKNNQEPTGIPKTRRTFTEASSFMHDCASHVAFLRVELY